MKTVKIRFAAAMLILLGTGAAFASTSKVNPTDHKWSRNASTGVYTDITGQEKGDDYNCIAAQTVCTRTYAEGVDANNPGLNMPTSSETGLFQ